MKVISWNVNGLRSVYKKGFLQFLQKQDPDIVCLQEIKVSQSDIPNELVTIPGYHSFFNFASKKGYSGVAIYTKVKPIKVDQVFGFDTFDCEGRLLILTFPEFILITIYIPHGGRQKQNLAYKLTVYNYLLSFLSENTSKHILLVGDFNVAHTQIDLARPLQNKNNIMFTVEEREQIEKLLSLGFVDTFRTVNQNSGNYTWWPYAFNARDRNLGWRLDYIFVSSGLVPRLKDAYILRKTVGSDHCPVGIEFVL